MLRLDGLFLLDDGDHVALKRPIVLLHPVRQLLVVDVAEQLAEIRFVDGLESCSDYVTHELANGILKLE